MRTASIAELLQQHRTAAGLTQEALAEQAKLSARTISDLERGIARHPYRHTVQRLVQALGLGEEEACQLELAARRWGATPVEAGSGGAPRASWEDNRFTQTGVLPLMPTPFIGRRREIREVTTMLLREDVRLVNLTGPGGVGKTRLGLQVAGEIGDVFPDEVVFVSLASLVDPELVPFTVATALGVKEVGGELLLATLTRYLQPKRLLLVLDNFDHLLPAAEVVFHLLLVCPHLKVLVTSRAVLHLAAEHQYPVPPLPVPTARHLPALDALSRYDAIRLFIQRAEAVKPGFGLTDENAAPVAGICCRLDGLPLAIELAAARVRLFPPQALLARLDRRLPLLTGGAQDLPMRHQTLRSSVDWSYDLLNAPERKLFAQLSVFQGGCSLEAAEAVCNAETEGEMDVLQGVASLVEKSLLRQEGDEGSRFIMLETFREYATERLEAMGRVEQTRERHAAYFLKLTEGAESHLQGPQQTEWFDRLEAEHGNLRAALRWLLECGDVDGMLRMAGALKGFWHPRCHFTEGRRWLEAGLARNDDVSVPVRLKALQAAGSLAMVQGDQPRTVALTEELLALARAHRDAQHTVGALSILGMSAVQRGDHRQAAEYLEECQSIARARGTRSTLARSLFNLGLARSEEGRYPEAVTLLEEALLLFRDMGARFWAMNAMGSLGYIALLERRHCQAHLLLAEYLETALEFQDRANLAAGLEALAAAVTESGSTEHAARLFAAAELLRQEIGGQLMSLRNRTMIEAAVSATRELLGEAAWAVAWDEGQAMTPDQAVAYALEVSRSTTLSSVHPLMDVQSDWPRGGDDG